MAETGARIVIVDDEVQIRRLLSVTLKAHGYEVVEAPNGESGVQAAAIHRPDVIILDLGLPDMEGMEVLHAIREWSSVPIIVLTAREQEAQKIAALEQGADDYVTKPFGTGELVARIRVALRHVSGSAEEPVLEYEDLRVDLANRIVEVRGHRVKLTPTEYDLLKILITHQGRVLTHSQLLGQMWGGSGQPDAQYIRVYVGHLRKKLELDPTRPKYIITEPGIGYRFGLT